MTCLLGHATAAAKDGSFFDLFVDAEAWKDFVVTLSEEAAAALQAGLAGLSTAERAKTILWLAVSAAIIEVVSEAKELGETPDTAPIAKINIPGSGFASPVKPASKKCPTGAEKNIDTVSFILVLFSHFAHLHLATLRRDRLSGT